MTPAAMCKITNKFTSLAYSLNRILSIFHEICTRFYDVLFVGDTIRLRGCMKHIDPHHKSHWGNHMVADNIWVYSADTKSKSTTKWNSCSMILGMFGIIMCQGQLAQQFSEIWNTDPLASLYLHMSEDIGRPSWHVRPICCQGHVLQVALWLLINFRYDICSHGQVNIVWFNFRFDSVRGKYLISFLLNKKSLPHCHSCMYVKPPRT